MRNENIRILVIDDDQLMRTILVSLVHREGYENVVMAKSGKEGLEKLTVQKPQIVFLDIDMLELDGIETLRAIKESGIATQVVMISGISTPDSVMSAKEGSAVGFIVKPPTSKKIGDAIKSCLKRVMHEG